MSEGMSAPDNSAAHEVMSNLIHKAQEESPTMARVALRLREIDEQEIPTKCMIQYLVPEPCGECEWDLCPRCDLSHHVCLKTIWTAELWGGTILCPTCLEKAKKAQEDKP